MLRVERVEDEAGVLLRAVGEVGIAETEDFRRELLAAAEGRPDCVTVDGSRIDYIFSDGLGVLVAVHNQLKRHGGRLRIVNPSDHVRELLHVTHLDSLLSVEPGQGGRSAAEPSKG